MIHYFIVTILFSLGVFAAETFTPPQGTWVYQGLHRITFVREYKISSQDLTRLGYFCQNKGADIYSCSKEVSIQESPELNQVLNSWLGTVLKIYVPADVPKQTLNTDYLKQYSVEQKTTLQKEGSEDFLYFPITEYGVYKDHLKIYLNSVSDNFIFEKQNSQNDLSIHKNFDFGSKSEFKRFSVDLVWQMTGSALP